MVHPPGGRRRVRLADGGRDPDLHAALRPEVPGGLLRRGEQATVRRGAPARSGPPWRGRPVSTTSTNARGLLPIDDVRAVAGLASRHGERATDPTGLCPCIRELVDRHFPRATKIRLVQDNLNTHDGASLYEAFPPEEARRLLDKIEFHYTPKHGSWLNMAETEISIMRRQCLDRRLDSQEPDGRGSGGLGERAERPQGTHPLDLHPGRRTAETPETLPVNRRLTAH